MTKQIALIAGEASGDLLGAALMNALMSALNAEMDKAPVFFGIGGIHMEQAGLEPIMPLEQISFAGIIEVVARVPSLLWRIRKTANAIVERRPAALIIIDSYDFTHRVARSVKRRAPEIPIINYVPPKVWAWRPRRAKAMKKYIERCLVMFPFEVEAFAALEGPPAIYVGHPALERVASESQSAAFRRKYGEEGKKMVILAPGSRPVEIKHLAGVFGRTADLLTDLLAGQFDIQWVMPVAPPVRDLLREKIKDWPVRPLLIDSEEEKRAAFKAADAALAASGTVTMELGLSGTPFVCAYQLTRFEEWLGRLIANLDMVSPVNLVLGRKVFPEFLGSAVQPESLADAVGDLLSGKADRSSDLAELQQKVKTAQPPSLMAAQSVLEIISR